MGQKYFWLWSVLLAIVLSTSNGSETQDETTPEEYLLQVNQTFSHYGNLEMEARWAYITDISEQNEVSMVSMFSNISSVVEFQRWWVLKCKLFAQESTCSKETVVF